MGTLPSFASQMPPPLKGRRKHSASQSLPPGGPTPLVKGRCRAATEGIGTGGPKGRMRGRMAGNLCIIAPSSVSLTADSFSPGRSLWVRRFRADVGIGSYGVCEKGRQAPKSVRRGRRPRRPALSERFTTHPQGQASFCQNCCLQIAFAVVYSNITISSYIALKG